MRQFPAHMFRFGLAIIFSVTRPLYVVAADHAPATPLLLMNGDWAPDYNHCFAPMRLRADDQDLHLNIHAMDYDEAIRKIDDNTVYTHSTEKDENKTYQVEPGRITITDSRDHTTVFIRCAGLPLSIDTAAACKTAVEHYGTPDRLVRRIRLRFLRLGISPYINLQSLSEEPRGCVFHFKFPDDGNTSPNSPSSECSTKYFGMQQPVYRLPDDGVLSLNYDVLNGRRPHNKYFEKCFEEKNGMSIWDKVIVLISNEFAIPMSAIKLSAPAGDCSTFHAWYGQGAARFGDSGCAGGMSAKSLIQLPAPTVASAAISDSTTEVEDVDFVETVLRRILLEIPDVSVARLDKDDDHITLVVRGLQNQVIVGSNYWERLTVNVFLWRNFTTTYDGGEQVEEGYHSYDNHGNPVKRWGIKEALQFRVIADGSYSAGSGSYPKDEYFTQNMEPEFHEQLTEFSNKLAKFISDNQRGRHE